jgi:hypothetical protein
MSGSRVGRASEHVEEQLDAKAAALERVLACDVVFLSGPLDYEADLELRISVEHRKRNGPCRRVAVLLETDGGYIEVVERIVKTLRHHYDYVGFVVPDHAMSAGTVLAMSGDAIWMDYHSTLGPIDPQIPREGGRGFVPAPGCLVQFERLIEASKKRTLTSAELAFLIKRFDPAELYRYEQARDLSIALLEEWLAKYKFRNWHKTRTRKLRVTPRMRARRAVEVAKKLNDTARWHSHARGISMDVLRKDLNLIIDDFGSQDGLNRAIRDYYELFSDYLAKLPFGGAIHVRGRFTPVCFQP